ncbi:MAG: ribokinase [Phycisphaerales bacterium]
MAGAKPKIVVVGNVYIDIAMRCEHFPHDLQTIYGSSFSYTPAGCGLNQAIQAALCDCEVYLVGKVGKDQFGELIRDNLAEYGVHSDFLFEAEAKTTGVSVSFVNSAGANRTIISEGANKALTPAEINTSEFERVISSADACLVNAQLPQDFVNAAIRAGKLSHAKVILDPELSTEQFQIQSGQLPRDYYTADIIVPNFIEAAELSTAQNPNIHAAKLIGSDLIARGVGCAVIKLGRKGAIVVDKNGTEHIPPFEVKIVDHTACGDAFDGAFAACCAFETDIRKAVKFACAAGALACSKFGAQESLPKREEILELLQELP